MILYIVLAAYVLIMFVCGIIGNWKVFQKSGIAGWKSIVPIYNSYLLFKLCWKGWIGLVYIGLMFLSNYVQFSWTVSSPSGPNDGNLVLILVSILCMILSLVISFVFSLKIARAFGQTKLFGIGYFFFSGIFALILGFDHRIEYLGDLFT